MDHGVDDGMDPCGDGCMHDSGVSGLGGVELVLLPQYISRLLYPVGR